MPEKVAECRWDGEHAPEFPSQEEIARLSEGFCMDCQVPAERDGEFSACPCCSVAWRIDRDHVLVRLRIVAAIGSPSVGVPLASTEELSD